MAFTKLLLGLAIAASSVSAKVYNTRFQNVTWDDDNWQITTTTFDQGRFQSRMSLANGYIGINLATTGPFFEVDNPVELNGWPMFDRRQTFATVAGFYDSQPTTNGTNFEWLNQYGGESTISGVPHWGGLTVEVDGQVLDSSVPASQISDYSSTMDFARSLLTWKYTWTPSSGASFDVEYSMFVHKLYVNHAAVQLKLTASKASTVTVTDILEGSCAVRTNFVDKKFETKTNTIWSAVQPWGIDNVTAYIYSTLTADKAFDMSTRKEVTSQLDSNSSTIGQSVTGKLSAGKTVSIQKFIGGASTDAFANPQSVAKEASLCGADTGYASLLKSHCSEWAGILTKDSVDDFHLANGSLPNDANILELQILAVTNPYHLLQNTVGANAIAEADNNDKLDVNSISVCGLGSSCYAGFIFWDAEVWMAPGLVVAHPQAAKQIANYRVEKFGQAQANVDMAFSSSQNRTGEFSPGGAVFPWTSGRFGNCTGTGPCFDYEYHINGDIGVELYNLYTASGDTDYFKEKLFPIYDAVAHFYAEVLALNESTGLYVLTNATDPDEYANHVDNAGFTMALIKTHLQTANSFRSQFGLEVNQTWATIADKVTIPVDKDADIILEYSSMDGSILVKQADVVLVDDLIDYPNPYSLSDLNYYASRQSQNGPGMTYGVFSVVANAIAPSGCPSYTYDIYGSQPYVRGPWFQFSEQLIDDFATNGGTFPAYPFLTGIGGANRVAVFGYLGLRLMIDSLNVNPNLPPQIPQLHYRTIYWQGHAIKAFSNQTHTTLTRLSTSLTNANPKYNTAAIPVTIGIDKTSPMSLAPGDTITIPNRRTGYNKTVAGNVAQCRPIASATESYVPGQLPIAAVDGSASTTWQPATAADESWITVQLTPNETTGDWNFFPIKEFQFDWAAAPPERYSIVFSNVSLPPFTDADKYLIVNVTQSDNITVSSPYDASKAAVIAQYVGNQTNVTLDKIAWSGRYVTLVIQGNQADSSANATGATVAEFSVIEEGGEKLEIRELTEELLRAGAHAAHQQL